MAYGWCLVAGDWWQVVVSWWVVAGGWWVVMVAGGWWMVAGGFCSRGTDKNNREDQRLVNK